MTFVSAHDGWAVGSAGIFHYDGLAWTQVWADNRPGSIGNVSLSDISMDSPSDGWAVGSFGILHFTGGRWVDAAASIVSVPPPPGWDTRLPYPSLRTISMVSATDGWAAGLGGVFWHYDGTRWAPAPSPIIDDDHDSILTAVQMLSPTEGWAVGGPANSVHDYFAVIEQFSGGRWAITDRLQTDLHRWPLLSTIAMASPTEGWAGGIRLHRYHSSGGEAGPQYSYDTESFMLRYHDGQWSEVRVPDVCGIRGITLSGSEGGWAVGAAGALRLHDGTWFATLGAAFGQAPQNPNRPNLDSDRCRAILPQPPDTATFE